MRAIVVDEAGGPEVLAVRDIEIPRPAAGEVRVRLDASGVNYIDIYYRNGTYSDALPLVLGREGAGVVDAVGEGVTELAAGDRVAWAMYPAGSYAEYAVLPAHRLVPVPDTVSSADAAAVMMQGITAQYLTRTTFPLRPGHTCLVHAAAGGVGLLLCQLAKQAGATVVGTTSTEEKAELVRAAGADHVINYATHDFVTELERTVGKVDVIYDGVGKDTFPRGFGCLKPRGYNIIFGQSSGKVASVDIATLNKGSLFVTRPTIADHIADRQELLARGKEVLDAVASGRLSVRVHGTYALEEAGEAHRLLESRQTAGKLVLTI
jgi:NADPH2:quinone reductase